MSTAARTAMIAMTTRSSIRVKPLALRIMLLDPNPWGVKKEGVLWTPTGSTPSTLLTQRPSSWPSTSGLLVAIYNLIRSRVLLRMAGVEL
jgi:hypothetical protein